MLFCPKKSAEFKQLQEDNYLLNSSVQKITNDYHQTQTMIDQLKNDAVRLERKVKELDDISERFKEDNVKLQYSNKKLEQQVVDQDQYLVALQTNNYRLSQSNDVLQQQLVDLKHMIQLFGNNIVDIEEKLFKTYYQYKSENKVQHLNNLIAIFISFDRDGDSNLNEVEFENFKTYIRKIYGQEIIYPGTPLNVNDIINLKIQPILG